MMGADFEVFVVDENQKLVHCDKWLPNATKYDPIFYKGCNITHDRKSLECAIPAFKYNGTPLQFYTEINKGLTILKEFIESKKLNYKILIRDTWQLETKTTNIKFDEKNIYHGVLKGKSLDPYIITNGLHIHFSGVSDIKTLIQNLDESAGAYYKKMSINSKRVDYGELGSYKEKTYSNSVKGFEYRVLGGKMLRSLHLRKISAMLPSLLK